MTSLSLFNYKGCGYSSVLLETVRNPAIAQIVWQQKSSSKEIQAPKQNRTKPNQNQLFPRLYYFYWRPLAGLHKKHLDKMHHFISAAKVLLCHSCLPVPYVSSSVESGFINMATETGQNSLALSKWIPSRHILTGFPKY